MSVKWALASSAGGATQHASDCTLNPRPGAGPYSLLLGLCLCRFPYNPLYTKKGTLLIPRLLLGLGNPPRRTNPASCLEPDHDTAPRASSGEYVLGGGAWDFGA